MRANTTVATSANTAMSPPVVFAGRCGRDRRNVPEEPFLDVSDRGLIVELEGEPHEMSEDPFSRRPDDPQSDLVEGQAVDDVHDLANDGNDEEPRENEREQVPSALLGDVIQQPSHEKRRSHTDRRQRHR